jgi:hypothetical protein
MNPTLGILLALVCALTTNVGFLFKHRGACAAPAVDMHHPWQCAKSLFGNKVFAIGWGIGSLAWGFHVAAMSVAPLSLVQAVLAGGVVLLAVMAERAFGLTISRKQWMGIFLTAAGLILLAFSLPSVRGTHSHFSTPAMAAFEAVLLAVGTLLIMGPRIGVPEEHHGFMLGAAAGILFGVSDVAIKALSGMVGAHGAFGLLSPWMFVAVGASVLSFYVSAKGLQDGDAVPVIAVTGTAANVSGIIGGILVFGDPLSGQPVMFAAELFAFALVLFAAWLTPAPTRAASSGPVPAVAV